MSTEQIKTKKKNSGALELNKWDEEYIREDWKESTPDGREN